jgi:hypothetical protein
METSYILVILWGLLVAQVFSFNALEQVGSRGWTLSGES